MYYNNPFALDGLSNGSATPQPTLLSKLIPLGLAGTFFFLSKEKKMPKKLLFSAGIFLVTNMVTSKMSFPITKALVPVQRQSGIV